MELKETFQKVKAASKTLGLLSDEQRNEILQAVADAIIAETPALLAANAEDLAKMDKANPLYDRLQLTEQRLQDIASDMRHVSTLPSPLGRVLKDKTLENGLHLQRVAVPFGVIGMIYEARPNVTYDVFSLCFKSGNACVLKGGKDANASNSAGVELIHRVLITFGIDPNVVTLLPATHEATGEMLNAVGYIDLCIPRGGKKLINFVRDTAKVPVIETGAGVVHCYFDEDGDLEMGKRIITNAKCRRVSVCNALDCLLIHESRLSDLPALCEGLAEKQTKIHADAKNYFSKRNCVAAKMADGYLKGNPIRQELLEKALAWIANRDGLESGQMYMAIHQHDEDANDLWLYFQSVINWAKMLFPTKRKGITDAQAWGLLYNQYHAKQYNSNALEADIKKLVMDDDVTKKAGIIPFILSDRTWRDEKHLSLRAFTESQKLRAYERQGHKCPLCVANGINTEYAFEDMEGDHIIPWSKGGHTTDDNLQMLCKKCNSAKSDK